MNFIEIMASADRDQLSDELFESVVKKSGRTKRFVKRYRGKIKWEETLEYCDVPEILLEEFSDEFNVACWDWISGSQKLSEDFIRKHQDKVHWTLISETQTLSEDFIAEFQDKVRWGKISESQKLSEDFIYRFADRVHWSGILKCQSLSEDFIRDAINIICMEKDGRSDISEEHMKCIKCMEVQQIDTELFISWISGFQILSEDFIRRFSDNLDWRKICAHQVLSEQFIREQKDRVHWAEVSANQRLSEDSIREFKDEVEWNGICVNQHLSEPFLREFASQIPRTSWRPVSKYQKLSEEFIRDFKDNVYWEDIFKYQHLSEEFLQECKKNGYIDSLFDGNMDSIDNWLYKTEDFKKHEVEEAGLYECHDDYFIAYKGIRKDRYSCYNLLYRYLPGETYEVFADGSSEQDSFGFSAGTEHEVRKYCNELIVKVKIYYKDVARVVRRGSKIRCNKITILE